MERSVPSAPAPQLKTAARVCGSCVLATSAHQRAVSAVAGENAAIRCQVAAISCEAQIVAWPPAVSAQSQRSRPLAGETAMLPLLKSMPAGNATCCQASVVTGVAGVAGAVLVAVMRGLEPPTPQPANNTADASSMPNR